MDAPRKMSASQLAVAIAAVSVVIVCGCGQSPDLLEIAAAALIPGPSFCGNGVLEYPYETCDDGNLIDSDGCSGLCRIEPGWDCLSGSSIVGWGDDFFEQTRAHEGPFVAVAAGGHHSLGLRPDGSVVGWGRNIDGQAEPQTGPFTAISAGLMHSLGLRPNGSVVGWGSNLEGQVEPQPGPFVQIAAGREFSLALSPDGSAVGWGDNGQGQCSYQRGPFVQIAAGGYHSLGLKADGSVVGWGNNEFGESDSREGPYVFIAAGDHNSLGLKADGSVEAWGDNRWGESISVPGPFVSIDAGGFHNLGILADGSEVGWGFNFYGQTAILSGPFYAVAGGGFHSLAILRPSCSPVCGDGIKVGVESCDDGNTDVSDGCDERCRVEKGWTCPLPGRACFCATGFTGEFCDSCVEGYWGFPDCRPCACEDGNVCNGVETCDSAIGCVNGQAMVCDDGRECSVDMCDPAVGCVFDISLCACGADEDCDDGDVCTGVETCDNVHGLCVNGIPLVCDDANVCNGVETCDRSAGCVSGQPLECRDFRECSVDYCDPSAGCVFDSAGCFCTDDVDCDDGSVCTGSEYCNYVWGTCVSGSGLDCDDGRICTADSCDPVSGCVSDSSGCNCNVDSDCDDLTVCTGRETCESISGTCVPGESLDCDDGLDCSMDSCDPVAGCQHEISACQCDDDEDCNDQSVCTGTEKCDTDSGFCISGDPLKCSDGRSCSVDSCEPVTGCQYDLSSCACTLDSDCKVPWERCLVAENRCQAVLCRKCVSDDDCGSGAAACLDFVSGRHCVVDCSGDSESCPFGFGCGLRDGGRYCLPLEGDCECTGEIKLICFGGDSWWVDSCDEPARMERSCAGRGCVQGACCPDGTVADDSRCVPVNPESIPERPVEPVSDIPSDLSAGDDGGHETDTADVEPSDSGSGCSAAGSGPGGSELPILLVLSAIAAIRGARRGRNARL